MFLFKTTSHLWHKDIQFSAELSVPPAFGIESFLYRKVGWFYRDVINALTENTDIILKEGFVLLIWSFRSAMI